MFLVNIVIFCVLTGISDAVWYRDLTSPRGLKVGDITFRIEDTKAENKSLEDRIALRVDYGDVGVSALRSKDDDGIDLDFFMNDDRDDEGEDSFFQIIPNFFANNSNLKLEIPNQGKSQSKFHSIYLIDWCEVK